jgi:Tfp pilus assembly protein PilN
MSQSINLIPEQERQEQVKTQAVKVSTVITLILALVVGLTSAFFYYQVSTLKAESKKLDGQIQSHRVSIDTMKEVEIAARNLDTRYQIATGIYDSRTTYSKLLEVLKGKVPSGTVLDEINAAAGNSLMVNGTADNYLLIAEFIRNLTEMPDVFTSVTLNSINMESEDSKSNFYIVVTYDAKGLKNL